MIRGSTTTIQYVEVSTSAFSVTASSSELNDPAANTTNPAVSVSPGTSALQQTFSASIDWSLGGMYEVFWIFTQGSQTLRRQDLYFSAFTDIFVTVRELLQHNRLVVIDRMVDAIAGLLADKIIAPYSSVVASYEALSSFSSVDRLKFDQALAYTVAAYLRPRIPKAIATGELVELENQAERFKYSNNYEKLYKNTLEEQWLNQAEEWLNQITEFAAVSDADKDDWEVFALAGPSRRKQNVGFADSRFFHLRNIVLSDYISQIYDSVNWPLNIEE